MLALLRLMIKRADAVDIRHAAMRNIHIYATLSQETERGTLPAIERHYY